MRRRPMTPSEWGIPGRERCTPTTVTTGPGKGGAMDRAGSLECTIREPMRRGPADEFVLPSRAKALAVLLAALPLEDGPLVLTGEAGVGKSLLCRRLPGAMPGCL